MTDLLTVKLSREEDVVTARQRARQVAAALGFDPQDQTRIATAVSEIARNAVRYAGGGHVRFGLDLENALMEVAVVDNGSGIADADGVLAGTYHSRTGLGLGLTGSRRIMDDFELTTGKGGTTVRMAKRVPRRLTKTARADVARITERLAREKPQAAIDELQQQNHELLLALEELRQRQEDLARLNDELEDTNRGVLALYAELDDKAESLRRADDMKSKFLSNMTHEFQTPLNSILALTRLLLDRADGDLTPEQERQVGFIREAAGDLSELVHDLLDIAKVEAGKVTVRPSEFTVANMFGALRGLMRPLQTNDSVSLLFEPSELGALYTDEAKVSQILRNYISNALKFTECGEVRVRADQEDGMVTFSVSDTGIGIAKEDQPRLFSEFGQLPNRLQARVRGTGLGLSLSKRLAELLGGTVGAESTPGVGSTFWVRLPVTAPGFEMVSAHRKEETARSRSEAPTVLVVDDEQATRYVLRRYLTAAGCRVIEAAGGLEGLERAAAERPDAVVLDLKMPDMLGTEVLARLKREPSTARIPVIIATSQVIEENERVRLSTHAAAVLSKNLIGGSAGDVHLRNALHAAGIAL